MSSYGPEHRALLESQAAPLYEAAVAEGGLRTDDPRLAEEAETCPAFDLLVELGLLHLDPEGASYLPEDPTSVQSRVVSPLSQDAGRLLEESSQWARAFGGLAQTWLKMVPISLIWITSAANPRILIQMFFRRIPGISGLKSF